MQARCADIWERVQLQLGIEVANILAYPKLSKEGKAAHEKPPKRTRLQNHPICTGMIRIGKIFFGAVLLTLPFQLNAIIIGSATDNGDGTYTYDYTVDNTAGTFDVFAWTLEFDLAPTDIDWDQFDSSFGGDVVVPNVDWVAQEGIPALGGSSAQDFQSISFAGDVLIGETLSGFSFVSSHAPSTAVFTVEFGIFGESATGTTVGPGLASAVPDGGSTLGLLFLGVTLVGIMRIRTGSFRAGLAKESVC
jgi:hypothetical protein